MPIIRVQIRKWAAWVPSTLDIEVSRDNEDELVDIMEVNVENDVEVEEALEAITLIIPISEGGLIVSEEK